jgi:hypothetical protein
MHAWQSVKWGGVSQRSTSSRQQARSTRIKEYFYGPDGSLQPVSVDLGATNMHMFRSGALYIARHASEISDLGGRQWWFSSVMSLLPCMQALLLFCFRSQSMHHTWCLCAVSRRHCCCSACACKACQRTDSNMIRVNVPCVPSHAGTGPRPPSSAASCRHCCFLLAFAKHMLHVVLLCRLMPSPAGTGPRLPSSALPLGQVDLLWTCWHTCRHCCFSAFNCKAYITHGACAPSPAGTGPRPPSSALPLGQVRAANPLKVMPVVVSPELEQSLLAVSHAQVRVSKLKNCATGYSYCGVEFRLLLVQMRDSVTQKACTGKGQLRRGHLACTTADSTAVWLFCKMDDIILCTTIAFNCSLRDWPMQCNPCGMRHVMQLYQLLAVTGCAAAAAAAATVLCTGA